MVQQDSGAVICEPPAPTVPCDGMNPLRANYNTLNQRIAALQKQIADKQIEAGWKLQELRRALRQEQANLLRISDQMNLARRRNLALQFNMDDSV